MRGRRSTVKSHLNFVIDFMRSPLSAFENILASHLAVPLDTCWKFSLPYPYAQTVASFLKWMLLLSMCERLGDHLSKSQHTRRQILGGRQQSSSFRNPCLQRVCAQRSASFSHHSLWVSPSTTLLLVGGFVLFFLFYFFFSSTECIVSFGSWFYQENGIRIVWDFVSHYQKYCSGWISPFKAAAVSVLG